ncbi:hypothetical protein SteCoe_3900 [Stentor coeruleus]|uniref:Uncharacterized protein n=1 Tax=Stentor coeruleus TaxID=5963 RepID=A0A1R2CW34_9CILI|nr:hypothetical protein SteCoe_3900 [Stentor coeruleus]
MHLLIAFILTLSLVSSSNQFSNLKTSVGQICPSTGYISIIDFDVSPWPPAPGTSSFITTTAQFNNTNSGVGPITYSTQLNDGSWTQEIQEINGMFSQYSIQKFIYIMEWPLEVGYYVTMVKLFGINIPSSTDACWTFPYSINQ